MVSIESLQFSAKFPFSNKAKHTVKGLSIDLDNIDSKTLERAITRISDAFNNKASTNDLDIEYDEILERELKSFPVAKILVSLMKKTDLRKKLAESISKSTLFYLEHFNGNKKMQMNDLAADLGIDADFFPDKNFFKVSLIDFVQASFFDEQLKLVNQKIDSGFVFLDLNQFARFLAAKSFVLVNDSLPVLTKDIPKLLKDIAIDLDNQLNDKRVKVQLKFSGEIKPTAFPDCMLNLYNDLGLGKNLSHFARFDLACFLVAINMPLDDILILFSKTPNFDEKTTRYQLQNIKKKGYAAPSCAKLKEHGLACDDCTYKHPLQKYRRNLRSLPKIKKGEKNE